MQRPFNFLTFSLLLASSATAQIGGDGSDGPFRPSTDVTLDTTNRPGGWNFTSIRVPANVTVSFVGDQPVILRSQGDVVLDGRLTANGGDGESDNGSPNSPPPEPGRGGPGGFGGGQPGSTGDGPGGGQGGWTTWNGTGQRPGHASHATEATPGFLSPVISPPPYGSAVPFDLRGGSGGGGTTDRLPGAVVVNSTGAGGGGVLAILCDGTIRVTSTGAVRAEGSAIGMCGSGGSVLLRAIGRVVVEGTVSAAGGDPDNWLSGRAGDGFVRIDSYTTPPLTGSATLLGETTSAQLPLFATEGARVGATSRFDLSTRDGDSAAIFLAFSAGFSQTPFGLLRLGPNPMLIASGASTITSVEALFTATLPVPPVNSLRGVRVWFQGIAWDSSGYARLSNAQSHVIQ